MTNQTLALMARLQKSTCNFMAAAVISEVLDNIGFERLDPSSRWELRPGGKYYIVKNGTAVFAAVLGDRNPEESGFRIISSHSDSPCFKIKPNAEIYCEGGTVKLNVEKYGGGILYTWFDRPLSISGRVMLTGSDPYNPETRLVDFQKPVCTIPHLAIHFNRNVNDGNKLSVQKDMLPVMGYFSQEEIEGFKLGGGLVKLMLANRLGVAPERIMDYELALYPVEQPTFIGINDTLIQAGRLDDLEMAFASLAAMEQTADKDSAATRVMAVFDNEETGSGTKQGAHSPVLRSFLERIALSYPGADCQSFPMALEKSFMVSADNAHAWHPNYNEKYDPTNHPVVGGGPAVKINANCKYMTDADGAAVFRSLCREAGVESQYFVNHSDVAGGSTLGNILTGQMDIRGVDMGCAIWAMHSAAETGSVDDYESTVKVFEKFFS